SDIRQIKGNLVTRRGENTVRSEQGHLEQGRNQQEQIAEDEDEVLRRWMEELPDADETPDAVGVDAEPVLEVEIVPESVRRAQDDLDAVGGETRVVYGDEAQVEADKAAAALRRKQAEVEARQREVERKLKGEPDPDNADRVRTKPRGETDEATSDGGQERTGDTESSTVMPEETRADGVEPAA